MTMLADRLTSVSLVGETRSWADLSPLWIALAAVAAVAAGGVLVRLALRADAGRRERAREVFAGMAQYALLFRFAAVAAAISAHGLIGFARANMALRGPWPFLLWGALDGAAGLCAVLLLRRAARGVGACSPAGCVGPGCRFECVQLGSCA